MTLPTAAVVRGLSLPELGSSTSEDSNLTTLIARADKILAEWCFFPAVDETSAPTLEASTYTEFLDGPSINDNTVLVLPVRPVTSVTSIHDDLDRDWSYGAADLVASTDYTVDLRRGRVYLHTTSNHGFFRSGNRQIKVIYVAGYDTGADERITQAISMLVAHWWQSRYTDGVDAVTHGDVTITPKAGEIPAEVQQIMWPLRLIEGGIG